MTDVVHQQEKRPSRKIYTITAKGRAERDLFTDADVPEKGVQR